MRTIAGGAVLAMTLVACGQKPGVHVEGGGLAAPVGSDQGVVAFDDGSSSGSATDGTTTTAPTSDPSTTGGSAVDTSGGATVSGDTGGGTTSSGDASAGGGTTAPQGQSSQQPSGGGGSAPQGQQPSQQPSTGSSEPAESRTPSQKRQVRGNDRTGAGPDKLIFGSHAPVTGAAPLPTTSFEKSGDLYWRNLIEVQGGDVLGRKEVELIFRDDKYDPNSARQVCRELAAEAFTMSGGGGTDQIQACGQFAQVAKVPYFSAGVTEAGLKGNPWYFAASMSYNQQGPLLAQMVKKRFGNKKVGAIVTDTPNFDDAIQGWEAGVQQQGLNYYKTLRHPKGDTSWYNAFAADLKSNGVEVVFILSSPVDYIRFAQQANQSSYNPQYVGVGISMGLNAVLGSGCPQVGGGLFFSPFPGLDYAQKNVPEFFEAGRKFGAPTDDIALALWGTNEILHKTLQRYGQIYGNDLTREDFRDHVEQQQGVESKVFPTVTYSPQNHFGAGSVHLLQANCDTKKHDTVASFATRF